jgi:hypothetical protein
LSKRSGNGISAASSTTSLAGLGARSIGNDTGVIPGSTGTGAGIGGVGLGVGLGVTSTPKTGASKMAAAAKRGQAGIEGLPPLKGPGVVEDEDHPLSDKSLKARYVQLASLHNLLHKPPTLHKRVLPSRLER